MIGRTVWITQAEESRASRMLFVVMPQKRQVKTAIQEVSASTVPQVAKLSMAPSHTRDVSMVVAVSLSLPQVPVLKNVKVLHLQPPHRHQRIGAAWMQHTNADQSEAEYLLRIFSWLQICFA